MKLLIEQSVQSLASKIAELSPNERFYLPRLLRLLTGIHIEEYDPKHSKHVVGHLDAGLRLTCGMPVHFLRFTRFDVNFAIKTVAQPIFINRTLNAQPVWIPPPRLLPILYAPHVTSRAGVAGAES